MSLKNFQDSVCMQLGEACKNGGTCNPTAASPGFNCTCPRGYSGVRCQVSGNLKLVHN